MEISKNQVIQSHEDTVNLVVAWRKSKGFEFGSVMTEKAVTDALREVIEEHDALLAGRKEVSWSVDGDVAPDEYMIARYDEKIRIDADAIGRIAVRTDDPIFFGEARSNRRDV